MAFEAEFDAWLIHTLTLATFTTTDGGGSKSHNDAGAKSVKGRVEQEIRKAIDQKTGKEVTSHSTVYLKPTATDGTAITPTVKDKITLPAGFAPQVPPIIAVHRHDDDEGLHHWEVIL